MGRLTVATIAVALAALAPHVAAAQGSMRPSLREEADRLCEARRTRTSCVWSVVQIASRGLGILTCDRPDGGWSITSFQPSESVRVGDDCPDLNGTISGVIEAEAYLPPRPGPRDEAEDACPADDACVDAFVSALDGSHWMVVCVFPTGWAIGDPEDVQDDRVGEPCMQGQGTITAVINPGGEVTLPPTPLVLAQQACPAAYAPECVDAYVAAEAAGGLWTLCLTPTTWAIEPVGGAAGERLGDRCSGDGIVAAIVNGPLP